MKMKGRSGPAAGRGEPAGHSSPQAPTGAGGKGKTSAVGAARKN